MYRLAIYYLASLVLASIVLSFIGKLSYNPFSILFSAAALVLASLFTNLALARLFSTKANSESAIITGLILTLITGPSAGPNGLFALVGIAVLAIASKYLIAWKRKHILNPAAAGVLASLFIFGEGATWWVGGKYLAILVIIFGLAVIRKIHRERLAITFLGTYLILLFLINIKFIDSFADVAQLLWSIAIFSPILFFVSIMLLEPQTSPVEPIRQYGYGAIVGAFFVILPAYFNISYALELSLIIGNIFSFATIKDSKITLKFINKKEVAKGVYEFWFSSKNKVLFVPGQFLEWTIHHNKADSRGVRRYFTVASSPEEDVLLATKISDNSSSFKKALINLKKGDKVYATGPMGSFTMPKNKNSKLLFIAGGIGVTPFRSMVNYLLDEGEKRDIVLMYMANNPKEFAFKDIFKKADDELGIKVVYSVTGEGVPNDWSGERGVINSAMIKKNVPDWEDRLVYLSGPESMARSLKNTIKKMGIKDENIKTDYFPGYGGV